jgi:hypothetical protein
VVEAGRDRAADHLERLGTVSVMLNPGPPTGVELQLMLAYDAGATGREPAATIMVGPGERSHTYDYRDHK